MNDLKEFYSKNYHSKRHSELIKDEFYYYSRAKASLRMYFSKILNSSNSPKILEFGVGIGQNIALLKNAYGYDISEEALQECRKRNLKVFDSIEKIPNDEFDIVLSRHSLEHVPNPLESLDQIKNKLKKGGILILILPKEKHRRSSFCPDLNQHLFCWNFRSINNLLNLVGFKPEINGYKYVLGFRKILFVHKIFGFSVYLYLAKLIGILFRNGELIIHARK